MELMVDRDAPVRAIELTFSQLNESPETWPRRSLEGTTRANPLGL
jgi:hypothetical protein